jgi:hypothetical protein
MSKKNNPGPAGTGRGGKASTSTPKSFTETAAPTPAPFVQPAHEVGYLLHVTYFGQREKRFPLGTPLPSGMLFLAVYVRDGFEFTKTRNVFQEDKDYCGIIPVPPRGKGWIPHDDKTSHEWTEWRRKAVPS